MTPDQASDAAGMIRVDLTPAQANALILSVGRDTSSRYVDDLYSPLLLAERALRRALGHYASADDRRHRPFGGSDATRTTGQASDATVEAAWQGFKHRAEVIADVLAFLRDDTTTRPIEWLCVAEAIAREFGGRDE